MSKKQAVYYCAVCGKEYTSIVERANCELVCAKRVEEEAKKAAEAKKKEEQKKRYEEVEIAYKNYSKLALQYVKDYGYDNHPWITDDNGVDLLEFLTFFM